MAEQQLIENPYRSSSLSPLEMRAVKLGSRWAGLIDDPQEYNCCSDVRSMRGNIAAEIETLLSDAGLCVLYSRRWRYYSHSPRHWSGRSDKYFHKDGTLVHMSREAWVGGYEHKYILERWLGNWRNLDCQIRHLGLCLTPDAEDIIGKVKIRKRSLRRILDPKGYHISQLKLFGNDGVLSSLNRKLTDCNLTDYLLRIVQHVQGEQ